MSASLRILILLLWRVRRRLAPDGSPLERLLRLPRRAIRVALGDRHPPKKIVRAQPATAARAVVDGDGPLVSLLVPIGATLDGTAAETLLAETIASVLAQQHGRWELWLCDSGVGAGQVWAAAQQAATSDRRIRTVANPTGLGLVDLLNQAVQSAVGELVGLVNVGDLLAPDALAVMLTTRKERSGTDVLYSDEASIDAQGITGAPLSKPNSSPELAIAYPYTGRLCLLSRALVLELGGFFPETVAAEEYDLVLKAAVHGARIEHVNQVLYHRRRRRDGEPDVFASPAAVAARRAALETHLASRRLAATIVDQDGPARLRVRPTIDGQPLVSIIIPTRDKLDLLRQCIASIEAKTHDLPYEIVIVDNNSVEPATLAYFASCGHRIVPYPGPFNFAGEINAGAKAAQGEYLLLLNNDTEVITPGWLTAMLEWAQLPSIGCVGAKLLFDDGAFQHVGIALRDGSAHHPFYGKHAGDGNRWTDTELVRNCAGATAACLMVRRDRFEALGGFDESFPINYNDIDFCIRLAEQGYRNLYTPYAVLYHHESASRPPGVAESEHAHLSSRHGPLLWNDPYWGESVRPPGPVLAARAKARARAAEPLLRRTLRAGRTRLSQPVRQARQVADALAWEDTGTSFYGLPVSADVPTEIGPHVAIRWHELIDVGGEPKLALFMHPPYSRGFILRLPPQAAIRVSSALVPDIWQLNRGGVQFTLAVGPVSPTGGKPFVSRSWVVNPGENPDDRAWKTVTLDLAAYAGQTVEVRLGTAIAPGAPSAYAWSIWGDPRLLVRRPNKTVLREELKSGLAELRELNLKAPLKRYRALAAHTNGAARVSGYETWLEGHLRDEAALEWTRREGERFGVRPTISLITPVYNTDPTWLDLLVRSVKAQTYPNWELCLCDDGSTNPATISALAGLAGDDPRIKTSRLPKNGGISAASNGALALATGEFVGLLDHDDELTPDALYEVVKVLQSHPDADLIYSDEDKLETDGRPCEPFFKPDWSPAYLRSTMYVGHLGVYRRSLVDTVGGFRSEFDGTQDYDLALRFSEHTDRVHHIPRILYRWRKIPGSTAGSVEAKPWGFDASFRALADHATRLDPPARAENRPGAGYARVRYSIVGEPLVSIVIPTDARIVDTAYGPRDLLLTCVRSVVEHTTYKNYELVIVDNGHLSAAARAYLAGIPHRHLTYHRGERFNFANKVNFAVKGAPGERARGEHILLLNDDIEVISEEWLSAMLEFSQQRDVGAVGAKLYFPDGRLQHIGVAIGIGGGACHIFSGQPRDHPGYYGASKVIRDFSAVTGACMMTSRAAFDRVGGFDERFLTDFNDVDYCLRLRELGYRIVYTPFAELYHYEGATFGSRERSVNSAEIEAFSTRWGAVIENDPFYNPNLTRSSLTYDLRI